jgi:serine/threonine protein kinase/Tol biopolymer transport system component
LGPYEITGRLGAGGMGEVFRAKDDRIGRDVAIKVLPASFAADADRLLRFEQEARSAGTLNHPNLVTIYDIGKENGAPYIVMELLDGETLRERMSSPRADRKKMLLAVADVADAIGAAHHAGVIHRDLKPENIIVTHTGYTKVLDFGLAKQAVSTATDFTATQVRKTEPGVVMGTAGYMSPEQAQGRPADQRSDIFALGCILYEALTGKRAFEGKSTVETLNNIINVDPTPVRTIDPRLPPEMQRIVRKCLAKDPDHRYQSAKDLALDLREAVPQLDSAPDLGVVQAPKRRWTFEIVGGLILAALAAGISWYSATHRKGTVAAVLSIRPLTTSGDVTEAAISPDGKYISFVTSRKGQQDLWLRQIGTSKAIPLVAAGANSFWGHTFSPDGASIYYALRGEERSGALYQIATLGGQTRKLFTGIDSVVVFSPDGKQMAFLRSDAPAAGSSALMVANADGSAVRVLAAKKLPEQFVPSFFAGPAWSPDGRVIVAGVNTAGGEHGRLSAFDAATGADVPLSREAWSRAGRAVWLPDGKSLIGVAVSVPTDSGGITAHATGLSAQLWRIDYPSGEARPITSGAADYRDPSITLDGRSIEAVAAHEICTMNVYPGGASGTPRRIGYTQNDGGYGIAFGPDNSIVYSSSTATGLELWSCDAAGTCAQIETSSQINRDPVVAPDGRIVFVGTGTRGPALWRINRDGSDLTMLAPAANNTVPFLSPDGATVYFNADPGADGRLMRIPIGGGQPQLVLKTPMSTASISPDGKHFAGWAIVNGKYAFAIIDAATGAIERSETFRGSSYTRFHWSSDSKTIYWNANSQLRTIDVATGEQRVVLSFEPPDLTDSFAIARDGTLAVAHGPYTRDAYLITGFE